MSFVALVLTVAGTAVGGYSWLSPRVTPWGDSLIVGPKFKGEVIVATSATALRVRRLVDGPPDLFAPGLAGRGQVSMTFAGGFCIYHLPPGTLSGAKVLAH